MLKKILISNLFWDFIIVLVVWGAISRIISVSLWMITIGVIGSLLLWTGARVMNLKQKD